MPKKKGINLQALLQNLVAIERQQHARPSNPPRRRRNRRPNRNNGGGLSGPRSVPGGFNGPMGNVRNPKISSTPAGATRLRHTEYWTTLKTVVNATDAFSATVLHPGQSGLSHLDNFAKIYERYRIHSCTAHYRTLVGTTTNGAVVFGVDWDFKYFGTTAPTSMAEITVKAPSRRSAIWQEFNMPLPSNQLMDRKIKPVLSESTEVGDYISDSVCSLLVGMSFDSDSAVKSLGEVWLTYDIEFLGPKKSGK
jgi:hypothetical protein